MGNNFNLFDIFVKKINKDIGLSYLVDRDETKQKEFFNGNKVISPTELIKNYNNEKVLICSRDYYSEIEKFLNSNGIPKNNIMSGVKQSKQYFDCPYFKFSDDEVFVDGGCFDCYTIFRFAEKVNNKFKKIIAFEADNQNYKNCCEIIKKSSINSKVDILNYGMYDKKCKLSFKSNVSDPTGSCVIENCFEDENVYSIEAESLDNICRDEKVTFIKMDIEGSELAALHGCENTIKNNKPKLAICVYHKNEDILNIQEYLMSIVPEYKFAYDHYSMCEYETLLYAFIPE